MSSSWSEVGAVSVRKEIIVPSVSLGEKRVTLVQVCVRIYLALDGTH